MNLAYIITAHKAPDQLIRLVHTLNGEGTLFLVHVNARSERAIYRSMAAGLAHLPNVRFLKRNVYHYMGWGLVKTTLDAFRELVDSRAAFDYVLNITGQDYPIKSNQEIRETLRQSKGKAFLQHMPLPDPIWGEEGGIDRIDRWYLHVFNRHLVFPASARRHSRWLSLGRSPLWRIANLMLPARRSFLPGLRPYGGSFFWCLPRHHVHHVHQVTKRDRRLTGFFKYSLFPDELFFQTLLLNSPLAGEIVNDDLRYIDWSTATSSHPQILGKADFETLRASDDLFARKFDTAVDRDILDMIDERLLAAPLAAGCRR